MFLRYKTPRKSEQECQLRRFERGRFHLIIEIPILNRQQFLSQQHLQLFDKQILRVVNTDEGTDRIRGFVRSKVRSRIDRFRFPIRIGIIFHLDL